MSNIILLKYIYNLLLKKQVKPLMKILKKVKKTNR